MIRFCYTCILILSLLLLSCKEKPQYRIGVSQCSDDDWRALMNEQIQQEIMFHPEATVEIRSASDSNERQIADIQYFIDNKFDVIIAAPNEADALTPVIRKAYESGIPVVVFDRNINGDTYTAFQGADNRAIGREAAQYAAKMLPNGGKVIELCGLPGSTPALERRKGFDEGIAEAGHGIEIVGWQPANWNYDDAVKAADSLLTLYPDVDLIFAHNDRMALGASDVARKKGLSPKIIGIDAAPDIGMQGVAEGRIDATFLYPTEGHRLIRTAMAILEGDEYDREVLIPVTSAVDKTNVDILLKQNELLIEETVMMKKLKREVEAYWSQHSSQTAVLYSAIAILILVCVVLFLVLRAFWQHRNHQAQLLEKNRQLQEQRDLEKSLNEQLAAATQSKLTFFTNVSHDLRTPLTLIAEPVEQLADASNLTDQQRVLMRIADRNVKILLRLINQILDFRKYENDKLKCQMEEVEVGAVARDWAEAFQALARKQHIEFKIDIDLPSGFSMAIDVEKTERVVFNLLGNAFKFTKAKGVVKFSVDRSGDTLRMVVEDTGRGIPAENLKSIFARFYQVDQVRPEGSGIGLSLAKAFVELQGGTITVESEVDKGTVFTVTLPVTHTERKADEATLQQSARSARAVADMIEDIEESADVYTGDELPSEEDVEDPRPVVLVIDDNEDVRLMVKELMKDEYQVVTAPGAREGIRLAARYVPDLIICDVMMPGMDGMECCSRIKEEISTSHIPVLMLTACSMDEQRVQGYESGADGYMSKPFNSEVLKARAKSLIANRRKIREVYGKDPAVAVREKTQSASQRRKDVENEFYAKFLDIVEKELGDAQLSVDSLAEKMGMGRSQFYRKIKALTNFSPVELLRNIRLKRARDLITTTDKSISEIAYEVGFSNPAYFTKCYREVYSETPTALRDRLKG